MERKSEGGGTTEGPRREGPRREGPRRDDGAVDTDAPTKLRHPQALRAKFARRLHAPIDLENLVVVELSEGFHI